MDNDKNTKTITWIGNYGIINIKKKIGATMWSTLLRSQRSPVYVKESQLKVHRWMNRYNGNLIEYAFWFNLDEYHLAVDTYCYKFLKGRLGRMSTTITYKWERDLLLWSGMNELLFWFSNVDHLNHDAVSRLNTRSLEKTNNMLKLIIFKIRIKQLNDAHTTCTRM